MKVGEVIETLIIIRDTVKLSKEEDKAVCAACNILSSLPYDIEAEEARQRLCKESEVMNYDNRKN